MEPPFKCPKCGGSYFGRDTGINFRTDEVIVFKTVRCHDEFNQKCGWRGEWPPKIDLTSQPLGS